MNKKILFIITLVSLIAIMLLGITYLDSEKLSVAITLFMVLIIVLNYYYFEKSYLGTKEIALIATLSAFAAVARVPFSAIPNVQPTTFLVALAGLVFGPYEGFLVGSSCAFISNIFLGQGPWTPWQMLAWGIVGSLSGFIGRGNRKISTITFSLICFTYGFLFDWIMNLWYVLVSIRPLNMQGILLAYSASLTVDIMHSVGNFVFSMVFYEKFYKVLKRYKDRLKITYIINN